MAECPKRLPSFSDATRLLTQVLDDSQGQVSASVYDTARLMSHTPWLPGHTARLDYLLSHQSANGTWGGPGGYTIVPTLSATEALLTEVRRAGDLHSRVRAVQAVDAGLMALRDLFGRPVVSTPDTIAVEFLVPALVQAINATLDSLALVTPVSVPSHWLGSRLIVPKTLDPGLYKAFIARLDHGIPLPDKTWAALEAFGPHAVSAEFIRPSGGAVAGSPSATASWLGPAADLEHPTAAASVRYLEQVQARGNGTVPAVVPITYFEAAWVLNSLALGQINYETPPILLDRLEASLDVDGAPAGPGIPADADDTAAILSALARHGRAHDPAVLMRYRTDGYFTCFPDERTPSVSTNAHVLEAFAVFLKSRPRARPRLRSAMSMTTDWLLEMQCADGNWSDKWHASPYYATACCVAAFAACGDARARCAIESASRWVLDTRRADGSWGRWSGTIEETSYAVQILLVAADTVGFDTALAQAIEHAATSGAQHLCTHDSPPTYEPLWHAKDLYAPSTVISAARLAALGLYARQNMSFTG